MSQQHRNTVFLAEKPSQARAIRPYLPPGATVVHALGHLLQLADPHDYDPQLKRWSVHTLPIVPEPHRWRRKPDPEKPADLLRNSAAALRNASRIVIATDPGLEGELIAREMIEYAGVPVATPILRLWTNALNPAAIRGAMNNLRPGRDTEPLHAAAELRSRTDWLEGINLTRLITLVCRPPGASGVLSVGRVQSPTLALLCDREREIREFRPTQYFVLSATATAERDRSITVHLVHNPSKPRLTDAVVAARRRDAANFFRGPIRVETTRKRRGPPELFDLASLQAHASAARKWRASKTLQVAQELYERHNLVSYPRTDCTRLDPTEIDTCRTVLNMLDGLPAYAALASARQEPLRTRATTFDAKAIATTDHHAIIPTPVAPPANLDPDAAWLHDRICRRFLAQFLPDWEHDVTRLSVEVPDAGNDPFTLQARGTATIDPGWKAANPGDPPTGKESGSDDSELHEIPPFRDSEAVSLSDAALRASSTKPPPRYTEGTLVSRLKKAGLGTKSTWDATIETLVHRRYVLRQSHRLQPTPLGEALIAMLRQHAPAIADLARTAELESQLDDVAHRKADATECERRTARSLRELIAHLRRQTLPLLAMPAAPARSRTPGRGRQRTGTSHPHASRGARARRRRPPAAGGTR